MPSVAQPLASIWQYCVPVVTTRGSRVLMVPMRGQRTGPATSQKDPPFSSKLSAPRAYYVEAAECGSERVEPSVIDRQVARDVLDGLKGLAENGSGAGDPAADAHARPR